MKPVITSFSPVSGPVGTVVTIKGTGFHTNPSNNKVRFGGVLASIIGGNSTSLTVKVPAGASFEPISVTSNHLSAYSELSFAITFNGGSVTSGSFSGARVAYPWAYNGSVLYQVDFNNDGRVDIVSSLSRELKFFRNTSVGSVISFEGTYAQPDVIAGAISLNDLDGDGKVDVVAGSGDSVVIIHNISPANDLAFEKITLARNSAFDNLLVVDLDGDGKKDIIVGRTIRYFDLYRNTSEGGVLSFDKPVALDRNLHNRIFIDDLNGDGKPDMFFDYADSKGNLWYYPNTSVKGIVSFGRMAVTPFNKYAGLHQADIDGDGKLDRISNDPSTIYVHRNAGGATYAPVVKLDATTIVYRYTLSDIDGDGRVDVLFPRHDNAFRVLKNTSTPGTISFAAPVDHDATVKLDGLVVVDANNDGRPDVIGDPRDSDELYVYTNQVKAEPFVESFSPFNAVSGSTITIQGNNFINVLAVSFGGVPAASFTVHSSTLISAIVGTGGTGRVSVTNEMGTGTIPGFTYGNPPVITAVVPAAARAGSSITIRGQHFSSVPAENLVYFGGLKAVVTSASENALVVTVPQSAGHAQVTVTVNNLIAYSPGMFSLTWSGASDNFTAANFTLPVNLPLVVSTALDFDGDGKLDLFNGVAISKNTSTPGNFSFDKADTVFRSENIYSSAFGDMDGDGKQDIVTIGKNSPSFSIRRNTSVTGKYSFEKEGLYASSYYGQSFVISINDIDGDGKPDILTGNESSPYVFSIFRNESILGKTSVAPKIDFQVLSGMRMKLADMDGDNRPDLIRIESGRVIIMRNVSIPGFIRFENEVVVAEVSDPWDLKLADLDGDGKTDMALSGWAQKLELLLNQSTPGVFSFRKDSRNIDFETDVMIISDLDGDGKPDINIIGEDDHDESQLVFFKNNSTPGSLSLKPHYNYQPLDDLYRGWHDDIDGDGRPDIVLHMGYYSLFIRNVTALADAKGICAGSNTTMNADLSGSTYQWQLNKGEGFVNLSENTVSKGVTTASLQLTNVPATWLYAEIRCVVDGNRYGRITKLDMPPTLMTAVTMTASTYEKICEGTPITFIAYPENGGGNPVFQWLKNDQPVGANSPQYVPADLRNNDVISVQLSSNVACPSDATVKSTNSVKVQVGARSLKVSISGTTNVRKGDIVSIRATLSNGELYPRYVWQDSTDASGWKHVASGPSDFGYTPPIQGAKLRCRYTSYEECITGSKTFYSNTLTFALMDAATLASGVRSFPNPVANTLTIELLNANNDHWESMSITGPAGVRTMEMNNIGGKSSLVVDVSSWARGYYVVKLNRRDGPTVYHKFMKL